MSLSAPIQWPRRILNWIIHNCYSNYLQITINKINFICSSAIHLLSQHFRQQNEFWLEPLNKQAICNQSFTWYRTAKLESKRRTGRKQTKWALCLSCPSAFLVLQHATGFFVQHEILVAKGLVLNLIMKICTLEILPHFEGQQTADGSL